ncbi:MAG: TIGR01459 family HAD-type hydrolase [Paracoccaceae bacterium]
MKLEALADIAPQYDAFLIDQFGVLIDGQAAYPGAIAALAHIADLGKPVVILSNSGKRAQANCDRVVSFGFQRDHFQTVVTSGEIAYQNIKAELGKTIGPNSIVMVLSRKGDVSPIADLGLPETDDPRAADLLLIVSRDLGMTQDDYASLLQKFYAGGGQCLCLNPDLNMLTPTGIQFAAGTIARLYEQLGGHVEWFGKPHPQIYDVALKLLPKVQTRRVLCVGDSIHHDILGGHNAGFATALVRVGLHSELSDMEVIDTLEKQNLRPDHFLKSFEVT